MVRSYSLALAAGAKRLSDVYGDGANVANAANDIPYRQLLLSSAGAAATIASSAAGVGTGLPLAAGAAAISLGPFETGPVKLSDVYAAGAGATLSILGVPF